MNAVTTDLPMTLEDELRLEKQLRNGDVYRLRAMLGEVRGILHKSMKESRKGVEKLEGKLQASPAAPADQYAKWQHALISHRNRLTTKLELLARIEAEIGPMPADVPVELLG